MASASRGNSIREILSRGILLSLVLSLLVGSGVLVVWQYHAQVRAKEYTVRLVRETLKRDAADLLTSAMLKNYEAVGFQLKTALANLPLRCASVVLQGQTYTIKGPEKDCAGLHEQDDGMLSEEISSGGMTIGPLLYTMEARSLPTGSLASFLLAFVALVGCVILTWGVLVKMINDAILRPLANLSANLGDEAAPSNPRGTCDEVSALASRLQEFRSQVSASAKREEFERVARMVAHNIDTPVMVLEGVDTSRLDDRNRSIYRDALQDIKALVGNLRAEAAAVKRAEAGRIAPSALSQVVSDKAAELALGATQDGSSQISAVGALSVEHLLGLVEIAVSEKRLQNQTSYEIIFNSSADSYGAFVRVQRTELKCILLNLMNNAVEALAGARRTVGKVEVGITVDGGRVSITISDDGPGIDPSLLSKLGQHGLSVGKSGSGLGLFHAKTMAALWDGCLRIESTVGAGTTVTVELPVASPPDWFASEISIPIGGHVVALDDDLIMKHVWSRRIEHLAFFSIGAEFKEWVSSHGGEDVLYLVDYELAGQDQNGLNIIEELAIPEHAILVTGRYDDPSVQKKAQWLGLRILPKPLAGVVPICRRDPDSKFSGRGILFGEGDSQWLDGAEPRV